VVEDNVVHASIYKFIILSTHLREILDWTVKDAKAFLQLAQYFGNIFKFLLVTIHIQTQIYADEGHERHDELVEISLSGGMPGNFLNNFENALLSRHNEKVHLLDDAFNSTTFENCWWVFNDNFFESLDACLCKLDKSDTVFKSAG
jgi:hypothetical protein